MKPIKSKLEGYHSLPPVSVTGEGKKKIIIFLGNSVHKIMANDHTWTLGMGDFLIMGYWNMLLVDRVT